jgi:hypothetical protein
MAVTYEAIATQTLSSNQASVNLTSIPSTYTDLIVIVEGYTSTGSGVNIQVGNGSIDTNANYSFTYLQGNGSSASSGRASNGYGIYCADQPTSGRSNTILQFMNYSNTSVNKTILVRGNSASQSLTAVVGLWRSTSAINCIKFNGANFAAGTMITIYGVKSA